MPAIQVDRADISKLRCRSPLSKKMAGNPGALWVDLLVDLLVSAPF